MPFIATSVNAVPLTLTNFLKGFPLPKPQHAILKSLLKGYLIAIPIGTVLGMAFGIALKQKLLGYSLGLCFAASFGTILGSAFTASSK